MKSNNIFISSILSLSILISSCGDMEYNEATINDEQWVLENAGQLSGLIGQIYASVTHDMGDAPGMYGAMLSSACDESELSLSISQIHRYYNGSWSVVNAFPETWTNSYQAIYAANDFLEKLGIIFSVLEDYKYNQDYLILRRRFELFPFQARFLRAYFHFELAKTYGDVPLMTKTLTPQEASLMERTNVQEVFRYIVKECDEINDRLPISYAKENDPTAQIGRINRPTVLALKARTLLYAASPLHTKGLTDTEIKELWHQAALASKELIDAASGWGITLSEQYQALWGPNNHYQVPEIIWFRTAWTSSNQFAKYNYPAGYENAMGGNCPTQNLVDAYEFNSSAPPQIAGKTWQEAEEHNALPDDPYQNLDPRFALTIARNGETWPTTIPYSDTPLETFDGGRNGAPTINASRTGYYLKKYVNGNNRIIPNEANSSYTWIIYRLGEFYLNYAEAMFNYSNRDATATGEGILNMSANEAINILRGRAGINMPLFTETGDAWEERYIRERMVELAFEGHRFWDVRRWKNNELAQSFMNIKTIRVNRTAVPGQESEYTYSYSRGQTIVRGQWDDKYYLYPIPFGEIQKVPGLTQNPGWFQ